MYKINAMLKPLLSMNEWHAMLKKHDQGPCNNELVSLWKDSHVVLTSSALSYIYKYIRYHNTE